MIDGHSVLAVVPARGGSKGLAFKNLRPLHGRPLIWWTIRAAQKSALVDRIFVSSDNEDIMRVAGENGAEVPFRRPDELAEDQTPVEPVLIHALDSLGVTSGYLVLLQPTSPLRIAQDIDHCIQACRDHGAPACVSLTPPNKPPEWMFRLTDDQRMRPLLDGVTPQCRQDTDKVWSLSGAVYVAEVPWFRENRRFVTPETVGYVMPSERSVDIDTLIDVMMAEALMPDAQIEANSPDTAE